MTYCEDVLFGFTLLIKIDMPEIAKQHRHEEIDGFVVKK